MKELTYGKAIGEGIREEMRRDPSVFVIGENVGTTGNIFKILEGLIDEFGSKRVMDTPLAEEIIVNAAVGAAMMGLRPVAEIMYVDFLTLGIDCLVNQAAKSYFNSAGQVKCPVVIRAPHGAGPGRGSHHTQSLGVWFANVPGLKVVMPSTAADAKGLIKASIRDNSPVVFLEHKELYVSKGLVPDGEYVVPLGQGEIKRNGSDVTVIATSRMVHRALRAAEIVAKEGIDVEVIDPRTLVPLDKAIILDSVHKTGHALVVHEAPSSFGAGAEIAAFIQEEVFDYLDAPVVRLGGLNVPIPYAPNLMDEVIPTVTGITEKLRWLVGR